MLSGHGSRNMPRPGGPYDQQAVVRMHGVDHRIGVSARSGVRIVERKPRRQTIVATGFELRHGPAPHALVDAGAGEEEKRDSFAADVGNS
jgi:hypothetical protein